MRECEEDKGGVREEEKRKDGSSVDDADDVP